MAGRAQPLVRWPGTVAALLVSGLVFASLAAVAIRAAPAAGAGAWPALRVGPGDMAALRFTLLQAALSAFVSVLLAVPLARALARRRFAGRGALIALLGAPFILPVIVAVLGLLAVFGHGGWLNIALSLTGLPPVRIYGLHGVVLAHVFFNLPLATRLVLQGWQEIPAERFRLAAQLGVEGRAFRRLLERPMLARALPGAFAVVFAICLTSFAVALTLGGGPRATTVELAIYQAFRFDFDLGRAAFLSCIQILLAGSAALAAAKVAAGGGFGQGLSRPLRRWDGARPGARLLDGAVILLGALFLLVPLLAVILAGMKGLADLPPVVFRSAAVSLAVAASSTVLLLVLALPMAMAAAAGRRTMTELAGILGLAASPLVLGTGLFLMLHQSMAPARLALPVTALVNTVTALPFALRILVPKARDVAARHSRLAAALNMRSPNFAFLVLLPSMRPQIGFAAGLGAALSMGDLGVIALFGDPDHATLPMQIYRLMGAYRMDSAAGAALLLLTLSMAVFWLLDRGGRWHAEA